MNVEELLELMEETLEAGTAVPFAASKRVVDVDRMRDIIDEVRNNLPDEVRESKKIVNDREQIMKNARIESESIIQQAEEKLLMRRASATPRPLWATSTSMSTWPRMAAVSAVSRVAILSSASTPALVMAS